MLEQEEFMSSIEDRSYHFYLIFGESVPGKEPWMEMEWVNNFEPLFDEILALSPYKNDTGLRVLERKKENETDVYYKQYKMGKLKWDRKSHDKWTLKSDDKRLFCRFESWTPRWTVCDKTGKAPDVYLSFNNEKVAGYKKTLQFDILGSIAICEDVGNVDVEIIRKLSEMFRAKRTVYVRKTWFSGKIDENNKWNLNDWMDCICSWNGMYKDEKTVNLNMHSVDFKEIEFEPYWEIVY
jgi:hypothetical protein